METIRSTMRRNRRKGMVDSMDRLFIDEKRMYTVKNSVKEEVECSIILNMRALSQSAFLWPSSIPKYSSVLPVINKPESPDMSAAPNPIIDKFYVV